MVLFSNNGTINQRHSSKKLFYFTSITGVILLMVSIALIFIDPILLIVKYQLRVDNGTLVHNLLKRQIDGPKIIVYLFNVTNADKFLSGEEDILQLDEIGPFVYQEYRTLEDVEINIEPGIMRYTPHPRAVFVEEESIGRPEDVHLVMPNIPMLTVTSLLSKYPYFIKQVFNMLSAGFKSKALINTNACDYLWGITDPYIKLGNSLVPGLIYFNSSGLMDRLFDPVATYRLELSTSDAEKFQVKKVWKFQGKKDDGVKVLAEYTKHFKDTYEGAIFPPGLTPERPISLYRHSICKTLGFEYSGTRMMEYGSEAFEYKFRNSTFDSKVCVGDGWCPYGLLDLSPCYMDFPFMISKGHYLDADPRLLERVTGLKPKRSLHDTYLLVDPKHPKLPEEAESELRLIYIYGPYIVLTGKILCTILSISLLVISLRIVINLNNTKLVVEKTKENVKPLLKS